MYGHTFVGNEIMSEGEFMAKIVKKIKYESTISLRTSWSKNC